jgi:hypothetical protein
MELKKDFMTYFAEAKDAQKAKENSDLQNKDGSHGDKADVLNKKISESDDCDDEDDEDKDEKDLDESLTESFDLAKNVGKNWGDELDGVNGYALKAVGKGSYAVAYKDGGKIVLKTDKVEVVLTGSMIDQISRLLKKRD